MKFVVALVIASLAIVAAQRGGDVPTASCTASGDPHFKTFDNCLHDFQGKGTFQAVKNDYLNVQYHAEYCNSANTVTCIKAVFVSFVNPNLDAPACVVRMNVYQGASRNNITIEGVYYTWQNFTTAVACKNGFATVSKSDPYFVITGGAGWKVQVAQHQLIVNLPFVSVFNSAGATSGICGTFDLDSTNDFTASNGTVLEKCGSNKRVNNVKTNAWGASYFVTPANSLADRTFMMQNGFTVLNDAVVPDETLQTQLDKVTFASVDDYANAKVRCDAMGTSDPAATENCVYDAAVIGDFTMAASNQEAANTANTSTSSSSGLNGGAIAGIVLGCIAFVSLLTAFVMYLRLRKLRTEYSRALIVRSQAQDTNTPANGGLADNL